MSTWPDSLFAAPILRDLDPSARRAIEAAGRLRTLPADARVYAVDELADTFFVVARGAVELWSPPSGPTSEPRSIRVARVGETLGEEAALFEGAGSRRSEARVKTEAVVAEIPAALFRRALGRSGGDVDAAAELRFLRRAATVDLLRQIPVTAELAEADFGLAVDAVEIRRVERGELVYAEGDRADGLWLIADGLVQLQVGERVAAYLRAGDFFGDGELLDDAPRTLTAVAMGACQLLRLPTAALRSLVDRNPGLLERSRRIHAERRAVQAAVVEASPTATRHVFADLYRMQMARSLLTIDQDTCVRCGHCAWSCEQVHGVARLVRRGDKVVTRLRVVDEHSAAPSELLLPNSCQHCRNPSCMIDCPTGAIGRDPEGEVFIRESLCTGCGACAKACPWENIRMAPRRLDPGKPIADQFAPSLREAADRRRTPLAQMFADVATKCDLCRDYEAPACVQSCPTGSIVRLEPERDFAEVAALLGGESSRSRLRGRRRWAGVVGVAIGGLALALAIVGAVLRLRGVLNPASGIGWAAGVAAAVAMLALTAHAVPKRFVRLWMRAKPSRSARDELAGETSDRPLPRSRVRPWYRLHLAIGVALPAFVLAHAGPGRVFTGPLDLPWLVTALAWTTISLGAFGGLAQAGLPRALSRVERRGALPEDLADERERLLGRLGRELSGQPAELKRLAEPLLAWARAPWGWLRLLASGRDVSETRRLLRARCEQWLPASLREGGDRPRARAEVLAGLDPLLTTCIELRALPARRVCTAVLRGWLAPHVVTTGALLVALAAHVITVGGGG